MVRAVINVRAAQNSSWPPSTGPHASGLEQSTLTWGFSISSAGMQLQLTQQWPSTLLWRYNPGPVFSLHVLAERRVGWRGTIPTSPTHHLPPLGMHSGKQLVSISMPLLGNGRTGSCGQTHVEDKWCDWSKRLDPLSERRQITSDYGDLSAPL